MPKKKDEKEMVVSESNVPDVVRDKGMGQETLDDENQQLPRVKLLQPLSPEVEDGDCKPGQMVNSLTGDNYGKELVFQPLMRLKSRIMWKPREEGGGILCSSNDGIRPRNTEYAEECLKCPKGKWNDKTPPECVEYINYLILPEGAEMPVILPMEKTKLKAAARLKSLIRYKGTSKSVFDFKYKISTRKEENNKGSFFVYSIDPSGEASAEEKDAAKAWYLTLKGIEEDLRDGVKTENQDA